MRYAGLDVHQKQSTVHVMDGNGREVLRRTVHGPWSKVVRTLAQVKRPLSVCFEASSGYGYRHRDLLQVADRVVVAHPGKLRLIFASKRKNDSVDAKRLALLLAVNEVPAVHVPGADVQGWRRAIHRRRQLVAERTRAKNALRALLREVGLRPPKGLWTVKGMTWLRAQDLEEAMDALNRDYLAEQVQRLTEQITRFQKGLDRIARAHPGVALLRTIPGVGPRTAEAVVAWIDRPERFARSKSVGCYFGLVPCQDASARTNRLGHITREGPSVVRGLLAEAAWQGVRRSTRIRATFQRLLHGNPERKKIAITATAHFMIRAMLRMLQTGEMWRETT